MKSLKFIQKTYYDDYWSGKSGWTPADMLDMELAKWLKPVAIPGEKVLDVGCGDGSRYSAYLIKSGVELHGTDISGHAVQKASKEGVKACVASLDEKLPFADAEFDSAVCLEVFEHLIDPAFAASEIFRLLRPGGGFVASVPNSVAWGYRVKMFFLGEFQPGGSPVTSSNYPWRDPHIRFFNQKSFSAMLVEAGFKIQLRGGLDVQFLSSAPVLRHVIKWPILKPVCTAVEMLGRAWPSLLAGRCVVFATKPLKTGL